MRPTRPVEVKLQWVKDEHEASVGLQASALVHLILSDGSRISQRFESPGIWGMDPSDDTGYNREVGREELDLLKGMLKAFNVPAASYDGLACRALERGPGE